MGEEVCGLCPDVRSLSCSTQSLAVWLQHRLQRAQGPPQVPVVLGQRLLGGASLFSGTMVSWHRYLCEGAPRVPQSYHNLSS